MTDVTVRPDTDPGAGTSDTTQQGPPARGETSRLRWFTVGLLVGAGAVFAATALIPSSGTDDVSGGEAASRGDEGTEGDAGEDHGAHGHGADLQDDRGFSELANGHQHEHGSDDPLAPAERVLLARQLAATAELVELYPTIADAEAAGWTRAGPFSPGLGTHYLSGDASRPGGSYEEVLDPDDMPTPVLVFDGLDPDAPLAGFMYMAYGISGEPEGFAGSNDHWHFHEGVCIKYEEDVIITPFGADLPDVTEAMCTDVGGQWLEVTSYMIHVWSVPGYESPDGVFTELNRKITCPDGTYHTIEIQDIGDRDTTCLNP